MGSGKDADPVPAPFADAVAAPASFRACHHSIPLVMDRTICAARNVADGRLSSPDPALPGTITGSDRDRVRAHALAHHLQRPRNVAASVP